MYIYLCCIIVLIDVKMKIKKHAQYIKLFIFIIETARDQTAAAFGNSQLITASSTRVMEISADYTDGSLQR